ncbi:hypothetical protein PITC_040720 [Penicillium italicum]|uniref:Ankyrin repeat-containing domain-containing protein n=1 Tax=Penicillium italicum TaxID=40296 RepID=A0A0A2LDT7_PENIT|nr:hypothetical protein PITC_040720 [Penicillium italicum]
MVTAASCLTVPHFELLLKAGGPVTSKVVVNGAENLTDGPRMINFLVSLLDCPLDDELWLEMMLRFARCPSSQETIHALLGMKPGLKVSEEVLIALSRFGSNGSIILDVILEDNREMQITDAVIINALEWMDTKVSSQMLLGAARNCQFGFEMTKLLLRRTATIEKPSSLVVDAVIRNQTSGYETLQILESHFGPLDLSEAHVEAAAKSGNDSMLTLLLDRCSISEATQPVLLAVAAKGSLEMMKHLLKRGNVVIAEEILIAASKHDRCMIKMLRLLWNFAPDIKVCPQMFLNIFEFTDAEFLFSRVKDSKLCHEILYTVMTTKHEIADRLPMDIVNIILEGEFEIEVTDEYVMDALEAGQGWLWGAFFNHGIDIEVSQDMVNTAVELEDHQALNVLVKHGNPLELNLQHARGILHYDSPWDSSEDKS